MFACYIMILWCQVLYMRIPYMAQCTGQCIMLSTENRKAIAYSYRINQENYSSLEEEAREKQISINILLNQIVKEHYFRQKFAKIGCVLTPKDVLRDAFDMADEKELNQKST